MKVWQPKEHSWNYAWVWYSMVVTVYKGHEGLRVFAQNVTQKPASHFLYNSLVLVRHGQALKLCVNLSNQLLWKFKLTELPTCCLQPSVTQPWKGLRAWFLYCLTSLCPKNHNMSRYQQYIEVLPNSIMSNTCIMDLPLSSFVFQFFLLTMQDVDSNRAIWLPTDFVMLFACIFLKWPGFIAKGVSYSVPCL